MKTKPNRQGSVASAPVLEPIAVRGLFGAIAADRHAAPPSRPSPGTVGEDERAALSLAGSDVGEVLVAHAPRQRFADRQQQGLGRSPAAHRLQLQATAVAHRDRPAIRLNVSSRSKSRLRGSSSRTASGVSGRPMCLRTKPLNHSRRARAWSATLSSSPGAALRGHRVQRLRAERGWLEPATRRGRRRCRASQPARSTGVAMELRKSRPGESAMKIAGGLSGTTAFRISGVRAQTV